MIIAHACRGCVFCFIFSRFNYEFILSAVGPPSLTFINAARSQSLFLELLSNSSCGMWSLFLLSLLGLGLQRRTQTHQQTQVSRKRMCNVYAVIHSKFIQQPSLNGHISSSINMTALSPSEYFSCLAGLTVGLGYCVEHLF